MIAAGNPLYERYQDISKAPFACIFRRDKMGVCALALLLLLRTASSQTTDTNPAFENIAPCSCDLTEQQYDNNCCCDPDQVNEITISDCISGPLGGDTTIVDDRICRDNQSFTSDWFPFTCIKFLNSPDLGLYYYPSTSPSSDLSPGVYSYNLGSEVTTSFTCDNSQAYSYTETIIAATDFTSGDCQAGNLTFPQQTLTGNCARSPVRYLMDTTAACDVSVTSSICTSGSLLDAAFYTSAAVRSSTIQVGNVSYFCATNLDDPFFVKTNTGSTEITRESLFEPTPSSSPSACGYTPPVPTAGTCQNAVASVSYTFTWNATNITSFDIAITLVNVTFTTTDSIATSGGPNYVLTQNFETMFTPSDSSNAAARSGYPGYEFGLPVISASDTGAADVDASSQLRIWKPGSSGLCSEASMVAPEFGFDTLSGCVIAFGFFNCSDLRTLVEAQQRQLLEASLVSRFGNPSNSASSVDWISVVSNFTDFVEENVTVGQCQGIPSSAVLEFLWVKSGEQDGQAIREIVGAKASLIRETWDIQCVQGDASCDVRSYVIYSTVTFTEVPVTAPTPLTSYELSRNDSCRKDATCWSELLLPIQPEFFYLYDVATADNLRSYTFAWALLVTFFSVAAVLVPAHWSSIGRYLKQTLPL